MSDTLVVKVPITHVATGETRMYETKFDDPARVVYMFSLGNYGCDCNRHLFFNARRRVEKIECGETRYFIPYIEWPDGTREPIDGPGGNDRTPHPNP